MAAFKCETTQLSTGGRRSLHTRMMDYGACSGGYATVVSGARDALKTNMFTHDTSMRCVCVLSCLGCLMHALMYTIVRTLQALDFYLTDLLAKYQKWLVESPAKMEIQLDNTGNTMKEMVARQV